MTFLRQLLIAIAILAPSVATLAAETTSDTPIIAEAEDFSVNPSAKPNAGWRAKPWGENYYCATFGNTFLSRKAFLGAPEQSSDSSAVMAVKIPKSGRYVTLARYEAVPRFQTQFHVRIEQGGKIKLDRLYGA